MSLGGISKSILADFGIIPIPYCSNNLTHIFLSVIQLVLECFCIKCEITLINSCNCLWSALLAAESLKEKFTSIIQESMLKFNAFTPARNVLWTMYREQVPMERMVTPRLFMWGEDFTRPLNFRLTLGPSIQTWSISFRSRFIFSVISRKYSNSFLAG